MGSALLRCDHYSFLKNWFWLELKFWCCSELTAARKPGLSGAELSTVNGEAVAGWLR